MRPIHQLLQSWSTSRLKAFKLLLMNNDLNEDCFFISLVVNDLVWSKAQADVLMASRSFADSRDVIDKVYSRALLGIDS
jgi:hypothetical protein